MAKEKIAHTAVSRKSETGTGELKAAAAAGISVRVMENGTASSRLITA